MSEFDPTVGRQLASAHEQAMALYRNANEYVSPPSDAALRAWLWEHRHALIEAAGSLQGAYLQVQQRDRVVQDLLQTLAETEARLPGITMKQLP